MTPHHRFLIDVNLPKHFGFVIDINGKWPDSDIWEYARLKKLVIVTKDSDFYHRCLLNNDQVKVIYFKLGNLLIRELHHYFITNWDTIVGHLPNSKNDYRNSEFN